MKMMKKVAVAISGGVDSGVTAALMVKAGYKVAGFHLRLWQEERPKRQGALMAARKTAQKLEIPFYAVNFEKLFKKRVVDYFLKEYGLGRTPNPCVRCNHFIKFGELLKYVKKLGYDFLATGHYARVVRKDHFHLLMGKDKTKDQSYFLYNLTQKQLAQVMFPVGESTKKEVKKMAKKWHLPVAERPESQEICFFKGSDYRPFLKRQIPKKIVVGEVVDTEGKRIGGHPGLPFYTIGQRHGFEINSKLKTQNLKLIPPYYIIKKDFRKNQLVVGFGKEAEIRKFWVKNVHWLARRSLDEGGIECRVRIRHQGELLKAKVKSQKSKVRVELAEGERGVSPGQAAVFYKQLETGNSKLENRPYEVLGGGIIAVDKEE